MKILRHTFIHVFVHVALFTGCALLIPVITAAVEQEEVLVSSQFLGGILLVLVSAFLLYRIKENFPALLQSLGKIVFLPGALNVLFTFLNVDNMFETAKGISGMMVVEPVARYYIGHGVPTVLSVAAVYMAVGGVLYWTGHTMDKVKDKFSWNQN